MSSDPIPAVLFLPYKDGQILMEIRDFSSVFSNLTVYLGGLIEEGETPEQAMIREMQEELGSTPTQYQQVTPDKEFISKNNKHLFPFLVTDWTGDLADKVLDQGNPVVWVDINEVLNSELEMVRTVGEEVKNYLPI